MKTRDYYPLLDMFPTKEQLAWAVPEEVRKEMLRRARNKRKAWRQKRRRRS